MYPVQYARFRTAPGRTVPGTCRPNPAVRCHGAEYGRAAGAKTRKKAECLQSIATLPLSMTSPPPLDPKLEHWVAHFRGPLVGLLASWGADWHSAEELAMDTFAEAWLSKQRLRADDDDLEAVGSWLRGIAQNLLRSSRRKLAAVTSLQDDDAAQIPQPSDEPDERQEVLRRAFAELRAEHQEVLRMHYLEETTARDVAALLGESQKAVEMRLYQARRALRHFADKQLRTTEAEQ